MKTYILCFEGGKWVEVPAQSEEEARAQAFLFADKEVVRLLKYCFEKVE